MLGWSHTSPQAGASASHPKHGLLFIRTPVPSMGGRLSQVIRNLTLPRLLTSSLPLQELSPLSTGALCGQAVAPQVMGKLLEV